MEIGDELDGWTLIVPLGAGGNASVWEAEHAEFGKCALKILNAKRPKTERYRRFVREVEEMRQMAGRDGVLQLIAAQVPETGGPAWLAMPICQGLTSALDGQPLEVAIAGFAEIAHTLAQLADDRRYHRDIKPENLYWQYGSALVGDFGLIEVPGEESITGEAGVNGPRHYVPWEVITNQPEYDSERADVYSLAKTIWVVSTRQRFPLPGPQRQDDPASSISSYSPHPLALEFDQLIERCTQNDPMLRPTFEILASDLRSVISTRAEPTALDEDSAVMERFAALMRPSFDEAEREAALRRTFDDVLAAAKEILEPVLGRVAQLQPKTKLWVPEILLIGWSTRAEEVGAPRVIASGSIGFIAPGRDEIHDWTLTGGFAAELLEGGSIRMYVGYAMHVNRLRFQQLSTQSEEADARSARAVEVARGLANRMVSDFNHAFSRWTELLESESNDR